MIKSVLTVARREIRGLVDQPTAYLMAIAFLGIALYLSFRNMYALGVASLRSLFDLLPTLFAVLVPALTMRSLAEEQRSRTLDWLLSQPLNEWAVVLGKFLGCWSFILIVLAGTLPAGVGLLLVSDADPGILAAQYAGGILLAAQITAIGIWASSITRNQITAFILAAGLSFVLFLIGLPGILQGAPSILSGIFSQLSVLGHFEGVARGVIDLRDVVYFVSATAFFLTLAVVAVSDARLSPEGKDAGRLQLGAIVVGVIALAVNLLGSQIHGRLDLTRGDLFTLSDGSRQVLEELGDLVQVTLYASSELPPEVALQLREVRDLLGDMRRAGGSLRVTDVNPDDDPDLAEEAANLGIRPLEFNVLRDDEFEIRRGYYGLAITYADEQEVIPAIQRTDDLEYRLVSAIARMTAEDRSSVLFATDGGARPPSGMPGMEQIVGSRYDLQGRSLGVDSLAAPTPDSFDVVVVAGPTEPLDSLVVDRITEFVDAGGAALLLLDPLSIDPQAGAPLGVSSGLESLLEERGVSVVEDRVVGDLASAERVSLGQQGGFSVIASYPLWPITQPAADHVVTRGLGSLNLGWSGAFELDDVAGVTPLWQTTEAGFLRDASSPIDPQAEWSVPDSELDVRTVAVAIEPTGEGSTAGAPGRIIAVADATFAELEFLQSAPQNLTFMANAIDWLAQDEALIAIRSKDRSPPALVFTSDASRQFLRWGNLAGMPLLFIIVGLFRISGRKGRAEKRWKEVVSP